MASYRIVKDGFAGYEVQVWRWWLPLWIQAGGINTNSTIDGAERYARAHAGGVVKYLGKLP
jgi:hypothetical protein